MIQSQMSGSTQQEVIDYVPKSEFDNLKNELKSLRQMLEDLTK